MGKWFAFLKAYTYVKKLRLCFTENAVAAVIIAKSFVLLYCKTFRTHQNSFISEISQRHWVSIRF